MSVDLVFSTRGNAEVVGAFQKARAAADDMAKGVGSINEKLVLTAKEAATLGKLQFDIARRNESAQDRYVRKIGDARRALAGHKNEEYLLRQETTRLTTEYLRATDGSAKWARKNRETADQQKRLNAALEQSITAIDNADEAAGAGFLSMRNQIAQTATSLVGMLGPIRLVQAGYEDLKRARLEAAGSVTESAPDAGELRQLAGGQEDYDRLTGIAERFQLSGAAKSRSDAMQMVFSLQSAEATDPQTLALMEQLGVKGVSRNVGSLAKSLQTYRSSFSAAESGSVTQMLSKSFKAAELSPGTVEEVMEAIAGVGSVASMAKVSDEETGAGVSVLAKAIGMPAEAKTALESFLFSTEENEATAGLPLMERVRKLDAMGLNPAEMKTLLGRKESIRAYDKLRQNRGEYEQMLADLHRANFDTSAIDRKLAIQDPLAAAATNTARLKARAELGHLNQGAALLMVEQIQNAAQERVRQEGRKAFGDNIVGNTLGYGASGFVGGMQGVQNFSESPTEILRKELRGNNPIIDDGMRGDIRRLLEREERLQQNFDRQLKLQERQAAAAETAAEAARETANALKGADGFVGINQ